MIKEISGTLSQLHKKNSVHRDIKAINVFANSCTDEECLNKNHPKEFRTNVHFQLGDYNTFKKLSEKIVTFDAQLVSFDTSTVVFKCFKEESASE